MSRDYFTFLVHVLAIFRRRIMIEKAHQRTVSHQRHNAICLILTEFHPADPQQHDDQSEAQQAHANAVELCRPLVNTPYHGLRPGICANGSADLRRHNSPPLLGDPLSRREAFLLNYPIDCHGDGNSDARNLLSSTYTQALAPSAKSTVTAYVQYISQIPVTNCKRPTRRVPGLHENRRV